MGTIKKAVCMGQNDIQYNLPLFNCCRFKSDNFRVKTINDLFQEKLHIKVMVNTLNWIAYCAIRAQFQLF